MFHLQAIRYKKFPISEIFVMESCNGGHDNAWNHLTEVMVTPGIRFLKLESFMEIRIYTIFTYSGTNPLASANVCTFMNDSFLLNFNYFSVTCDTVHMHKYK